LAAAIEKKFGVKPELIEGGGGNFDVLVNGELIYCKKETGRFPEDAEVLGAMASKSG
jgi:selT/selW/selH-like putative selenoprotein